MRTIAIFVRVLFLSVSASPLTITSDIVGITSPNPNSHVEYADGNGQVFGHCPAEANGARMVDPANPPLHIVGKKNLVGYNKTWLAGFPGSGSKTIGTVIQALTGLDASGRHCEDDEVISCRTRFPTVEHDPSWTSMPESASFNDNYFLLLRNPAHSIPAYFTYLQESWSDHTTETPQMDWRTWRDANWNNHVDDWVRLIHTWEEESPYTSSLYLPFENLVNPTKGPQLVHQLAEELVAANSIASGDYQSTLDADMIPCLWKAVVMDGMDHPTPSALVLTEEQNEYMLNALDDLLVWAKQRPADSAGTRLVDVLTGYHSQNTNSTFSSSPAEIVLENDSLPLCYSTAESRMRSLSGAYHKVDASPSYWNLSCPLEWSKYSCVHQGSPGHAKLASKLKFSPDGCQFGDRSDLSPLNGKTIIFKGDSLVRQVYISLSCLLMNRPGVLLVDMDSDWAPCDGKGWACHGTENCVPCGEHSGFERSSVVFQQPEYDVEFKMQYETDDYDTLTGDHVIITQASIHYRTFEESFLWLPRARDSWNKANDRPTIFHFVSWGPHFRTSDGGYHINALEQLELERGMDYARGCDAHGTSRSNSKVQDEMHFVADMEFDGILWLDGSNDLGSAMVGRTMGDHGDCQHFCLPGPPNEIALALEWMMIQHFASKV